MGSRTLFGLSMTRLACAAVWSLLCGTAVAQHKVTLTWNAPTCTVSASVPWCPAATSYLYDIFRSDCPDCPFYQINKGVVTVNTYTDTNVQAGATYRYSVKTVLQSGPSNKIVVKVPTP